MAIQLTATDVHLTSVVTNFPNRALPMSMSCWVNSTDWTSGNPVSMVGVYLDGTTAIQIGTRGGGAIDVWSWGGAVNISTTGLFNPTPETWLHIAYTWNGTTHSIYADGNLITTSTTAVTSGVLSAIYINGFPTGGLSEVSSTFVDDVAYYSNELTAAEVSTVYMMRGYRDSIFDGLIARYCFNELPPGSNVTSVVDYSGNNNLLTLTGTGTSPVYVAGVIDLDERPVLG